MELELTISLQDFLLTLYIVFGVAMGTRWAITEPCEQGKKIVVFFLGLLLWFPLVVIRGWMDLWE